MARVRRFSIRQFPKKLRLKSFQVELHRPETVKFDLPSITEEIINARNKEKLDACSGQALDC